MEQTIMNNEEILSAYSDMFIAELIRTLRQHDVLKITYKKFGTTLEKYFSFNKDGVCFSPTEKTLTLFSIFEQYSENINMYNIDSYTYTEDTTKDNFCKTKERLHEAYKCFIQAKRFPANFNFEKVFFNAKLNSPIDICYMMLFGIEDVSEYYSPTTEQLLSQKNFMIQLLQEAATKQIEQIKKEFFSLQQENPDLQHEELDAIIEFIDEIKQNTSIFDNCNKPQEMFEKWPDIFDNPISKWTHKNLLFT